MVGSQVDLVLYLLWKGQIQVPGNQRLVLLQRAERKWPGEFGGVLESKSHIFCVGTGERGSSDL